MDTLTVKHPYTIFQVIEINLARSQSVPTVESVASADIGISHGLIEDEFYRFVLCVKHLNKPTLQQIDQQRIDLVYWLSEYFGRYIPTEFLLPIVDIDVSASSLNIFLPRLDINSISVSLEDIYMFLKKISPFIDVPEEIIDEWRYSQKEKRLHQQRYMTRSLTIR